jgi:hypothetical protein
MHKLLLTVAACGLCAPAMAQTTPQQPAPVQPNTAQTAQPAQTKTVQKQVCEKVAVERSTGSRLNSTTKICKIVEVPVAVNDGHPTPDAGSTNRY